MQGRTIVITGATSGIGQVAAERLAQQGAKLILVGRDRARGEATLARIRAAAPGADLRIVYGDLQRLSEMKRVAAEIAALAPRIDVLINNAGSMYGAREVTPDGLERTFATNHMAYFVVTNALLPNLKAAGNARIVSTASDAHLRQSLDFDDLQSARSYSSMRVYGRSKLANILFTRELARRLAGSNVTANCLHPGLVATRFGSSNGPLMRAAIKLVTTLGGISPEDGAKTIVYLASSPEIEGKSGGYYYKNRIKAPSRQAQDDASAARLWAESEKIAGMAA